MQLAGAVVANRSDVCHVVHSLIDNAPAPVRARVTLRNSNELCVTHFGNNVSYSLECTP